MRRHTARMFVIAAVAAITLAAATARPTRAQDRPDAPTVAAWVQAFYDQTQSMSAAFVQRYVNRVYQREDTSRGRVRFRKPGMMRFDYADPNGKVIVSDGARLVAYDPPDEGESRGQYVDQQISDAQLPAALSFLTGTGRLDEDFRFRSLDASALNYDGEILELRGRRPNPHYARILLFVDAGRGGAAGRSRRGMVHRILIFDSSNNRNRFDFTDQQVNRPIPESVFRWRPPGNARRIQP